LLRLTGLLLGLVCLGWIFWRFAEGGVLQALLHAPERGIVAWRTLAAVPVYTLGLCFVGFAWVAIQSSLVPARLPKKRLFAVYATSQFAKYLPGNVGHFVTRHVLLRRLGLGHAALLAGTLIEAGMLVVAAALLATGALPAFAPGWSGRVVAAAIVVVVAISLQVAFAFHRRPEWHRWLPMHRPGYLLVAWPLQGVYFGIMALALMLPATALPLPSSMWLALPATVAASWIAGYLVVGAPAGIGVREFVFLVLLKGHLPEGDILLLAAAFRVITFGGDCLLLLVGVVMGGTRTAIAADTGPVVPV
jgi:hypothetical protein